MNYWIYGVLIGTILFLVAGGFLIYYLRRKKQNLHFAKVFKLSLSGNVFAPEFKGIYRRYQISIAPFRDSTHKNRITMRKISVKMQNPNNKFFLFEKQKEKSLPTFLNEKKTEMFSANHFEPEIKGFTNDSLMIGVILTEEIKGQIIDRMREIHRGMLYLSGEELVFLSPVFSSGELFFSLWMHQMDLLCDIKDTLQ